MPEKKKEPKIHGKIIHKVTGEGIPRVAVRAFDKDLLFDDFLGAVITDENGYFEITYNKEDFQEICIERKPDIYLEIIDSNGKLIFSTRQKPRHNAGDLEEFIIEIPGISKPDHDNDREDNLEPGRGGTIGHMKMREESLMEKGGVEMHEMDKECSKSDKSKKPIDSGKSRRFNQPSNMRIPERIRLSDEELSEIKLKKNERMIRDKQNLAEYVVKGKVSRKDLKEISQELPLYAYATRDRKVLGSAPVKNNGSFSVDYRYKITGRKRKPIGVYLIIGPKLPGDQILKTNLERKFLSSKGFKKVGRKYMYPVEKTCRMMKNIYEALIFGFKHTFTFKGNVMSCSSILEDPAHPCPLGCFGGEVLSTTDNHVYVRLFTESEIIALDIPVSNGSDGAFPGEFSYKKTWYSPYLYLYPMTEECTVEVYQKIGSITNVLYNATHVFQSNLPQYFCIDRDDVEIIEIPEPEGAGSGNSFGFTRVGNIPIDYVIQNETSPFGGYADSSLATDSATHKVDDYAFGGELHLYANIGEDLLLDPVTGDCKIKYIRVKYHHLDTVTEGYIQSSFGNAREPRAGEGIGLVTEAMGPLPTSETGGMVGVYKYANPYETAALYPTKPEINDWVYKGLLLVLPSSSFPFNYGIYRLTLEAFDNDMNPVTDIEIESENDYDMEFILLVDNDHSALSGDIKDIMGTTACGFLDKRGIMDAFDITVDFDVNDTRGNLRYFKLTTHWGSSESLTLSQGEYPTYPGISPPIWMGDSGISAIENRQWVQCAYEFRLRARRRVTNGFNNESEKEIATKHITIQSDFPY